MGKGLERTLELDARLVEVAGKVKVLSTLAWDEAECERFLEGWRRGKPRLPAPEVQPVKVGAAVEELTAIASACDFDDPLAAYIGRTARSYAMAARMLAAQGTRTFTELSGELYGQPRDHVGPGGLTNLDAAEHFVKATTDLAKSKTLAEEPATVSPAQVQAELQRALDVFFKDHPVKVVLESNLTAKAAAGADRIRVRSASAFTPSDIPQLLQHEGLVHTLTLKNGRLQPKVRSLGLGAPRTTPTQEGLATLAELVTSSIDLSRLRRLALRVLAIHQAMHGADFVQVFRFFLEAGQSEQESYHSAQRIFRGGDVKGGSVFTKDGCYLWGLIATHTFLRKAVQEDRPHFVHALFAGRLTLGDVVSLEPYFQSGVVVGPQYEPPWVQNRTCLAATLAFQVFTSQIDLAKLKLEDFEHDF